MPPLKIIDSKVIEGVTNVLVVSMSIHLLRLKQDARGSAVLVARFGGMARMGTAAAWRNSYKSVT